MIHRSRYTILRGKHLPSPDAKATAAAPSSAPSHLVPAARISIHFCLGLFITLSRGVMGFWKVSPFLALSILVLYQAGMLQAAPLRSDLESDFDPATLTEEDMCLLLAAMVKDYVQMKVGELEQETEDFSITAQKRSCDTATCVTHKIAGWLSRSGSVVKRNFVPTNVGSEAFGQDSRELQF
ncbi:Calcitonin receptor-stimulating peptide 2 [Camelus dromedarius]|uniref:Calcitonin receptor-stimulating peptide 2 n=2 Tax=Camelus TaxID=9836 RepID=A0A5N4DNX9_CAMDR|nr:Calcitonin receptor-stimulating peptide 2 [Camelus dromedarius]